MDILTIRDMIRNAERQFDNVAFQIRREDGSFRKLTYPEAVRQIKQLMQAFKSLGLKSTDKIAILSENRPEWSVSYLAVASYGAIAVPLDSLAENALLERVLVHSEAKYLIFSSKFKEFVDDLDIDIKLVNFDLLAEDGKCLSFGDLLRDEISWDELDDLRDDALAAILYTSGTTGGPKGVMLSHKNIVSNVTTACSLFKVGRSDKLVSVLPLHHTFEATAGFLAPFLVGAMVTHSESLKSTKIVQNLKDTKATILVGVPLLFQLFYEGIIREVLDKGPAVKFIFNVLLRLSRLLGIVGVNAGRIFFFFIHNKLGGHIRFWVAGGAAIDADLLRAFLTLGITIYQGYGLTESSPVISACNSKANRFGSVGRPLPGIEIKIKDPDRSGVGEIVAKGPNIMQGYYKNEDATREVLKDGWLYTGDLGYVDKEGFLYISGRIKDIIVSSAGVNVYPDEIEFEMSKIAYIKESCVIGRRVERGIRKGTEDVVAIVQPDIEAFEKNGLGTEVHDMHEVIWGEIEKLNESLPMHKRISSLEIRLGDFPKTSTRKIKRYQVRKEMEQLWRT